jgi:Zn-dependent protease with chaperone function
MFLAGLAPIALYVLVSIAVGALPALRTRLEVVSSYQGVFAAVLVVAFALLLPFLLSRTWDTAPIPAGPQRAVLEHVAERARFRARELLVWRTGGTMANAAIVGAGPRTRVVLFSDVLLAQLEPSELAAVFAHEIGHAARRHVLVFLAFAGGTFLGIDWVANELLADHPWTAGAFVLAALAAGYLTFGWLSRRFELEADLHGLDLMRDPHALIAALEKVGGSFRDVASWRHFSTSKRVEFLVRAAADPRVGERLRRVLGLARWAAAALFLVTLGLQGWSLARRTPGELVRLDLCLGRYVEANARAGKVEDLDPGVRALAARGSELPEGEHTVDALRERARAAMRVGDARAAHEWLLLAVLRGAEECGPVADAVRQLTQDADAFGEPALAAVDASWRDDLAALRRLWTRAEPSAGPQ